MSDERQNVENKIVAKQNESLASTNRTLAMLYESQETGQKTMEELVRQGEQLESTDANLKHIDANLRKNEKTLSAMGSFFTAFNCFAKKPNDDDDVDSKLPKLQSKGVVEETIVKKNVVGQQSSMGSRQTQVSQINPKTGVVDTIEDQIVNNLDQLADGLTMLGNLAKGLDKELDRQNVFIEGIQSQVDENKSRIEVQDKIVTKMYNK